MKMTSTTITLMISLAVNLILIGALAGLLLKQGNLGPRGEARAGPGIERLSPEDRRVTLRIFREAIAAASAERAAHDIAKKALNSSLAKANIDPAEVETDFTRLRETEAAMRAKMQDALLPELVDLSPEQRGYIARRLATGPNRPSRQRRPRPRRHGQ